MPFANNNGIQIYYEIEGAGPPLILGHGMMGSIEDLRGRNYLGGLTQDFQVILFDARGHGKSDKPANLEAYYLQSILKDVLAVLDALGIEEPGLNRVIRAGYKLLGLHHYFTAGPKEVRAWTVPIGARAPQAAAVIHTDFERGFIRAEVVSYEDFVAGNGEQGAKDAGRWRLEGKDYVVQDGDVVHFRFNV